MTDIKSWIQSKTIWSILITISPVLSKMLGFDFGETLTDVITILGAAAAIFFRIKASEKLK